MNRREFLCGGIAMLGVGAAGRAVADAMARHPLAGKSLPKWEKGHFRISMIYTGASESSFLVFPDGTSMLIDCGDCDVGVDAEKFRRLLGIYDRAGIWYIEGPHLANFSNGWGSPTFYTALTTNVTTSVLGALKLSRLARQLQAKIDEYGLRDRWYQHVADEPGGKNVGEYRITAGIVRRYMPGVRTIDAVEEPSFAGALDVWVPKVDAFERHRALYESFRTNFHDRVWCYTCCIPGGKWMNRLLDHELLRPALIPWVSGMYDVDGFLHWGYNWWRDGSDPFKDTIVLKRKPPLPAGDTHIVYPGKDGPWSSARLEATRAGMEDADLLATLRRRDRAGADAIVRRMARGYGDYSTSCKLYRETRRDLLRALLTGDTK